MIDTLRGSRTSNAGAKMSNVIGGPLLSFAFSLVLAGHLLAQDSQQMTLVGLKNFAVHAQVQLSEQTSLPPIDQNRLRSKMEEAIRQEGMTIVRGNDVRDAPGAHLSLLYIVIETRDRTGQEAGFAAFSCLQAEQTVSVPRLGRYVYAVVPTWRSCGIVAGDTESYSGTIERNADKQIARFLAAWRMVNPPRRAPPVPSDLGLGTESSGAVGTSD
jgi:hypothetical protein